MRFEEINNPSYEKIWDELSKGDKKVLCAINSLSKKNENSLVKVEEIRELTEMTSNTFTTYRKRLIDNGLVDGKQYGFLALKLPRFGEFIDMCPAP